MRKHQFSYLFYVFTHNLLFLKKIIFINSKIKMTVLMLKMCVFISEYPSILWPKNFKKEENLHNENKIFLKSQA